MDNSWSQQGLGTWWQYQGTQRGPVQSCWPEERERPQEKKEHPQGGGGEEPRGGLQIFSPHQPTGQRRFYRALWVTSIAQLFTRHTWSILPSKSKRPRSLLLPCWCSCIALSSPSYGSDHRCLPAWGQGALLNLLLLLDVGAQLCKYKPCLSYQL